MHPRQASVGIIGGGWAGLTCALKLARAGIQPVVYESAPEPGGRARRAKLDGLWRDNGQHIMLAGCTALTTLFDDIDINVPCVPFEFTDGYRHLSLAEREGRFGLVRSLLSARGFTWRERYALLRALLALQFRGWRTVPDQTVAQWLQTQRQPLSLIDAFWAPLALAILNTSIEQAAMGRLAPVLRDTLGAGSNALAILQPPTDLSVSIVTPLTKAIEEAGGRILCGQRVRAIQRTADGDYALKDTDASTTPVFSQVVLAVPPWALTHMQLPFDAASLAERFRAQPIATVYLGFDDDVRLPAPLVQLTGPTAQDAHVWAMDRAHCGESGVMAVSLSADGPWRQLDDATLAERCIAHLQTIGLNRICRWHKVVTIQKATPAATPQACLAAHEYQPLPGLWLAGDWTHPYYPATLEAAVRSGLATAEKIIGAIR